MSVFSGLYQFVLLETVARAVVVEVDVSLATNYADEATACRPHITYDTKLVTTVVFKCDRCGSFLFSSPFSFLGQSLMTRFSLSNR